MANNPSGSESVTGAPMALDKSTSHTDEFARVNPPEPNRVNPSDLDKAEAANSQIQTQTQKQTQTQTQTEKQNSPQTAPKKSFAEAVSNSTANRNIHHQPPDLRKYFLADHSPQPFGIKSFIHGRPTLSFTDTETEELAAPYRFSLVGKFSHGAPSYSQMHQLIARLGIQGAFTVSMINSKHTLISLTSESDYSRLWLRRIWFLQGFPMRVFKWTPTFTPTQESSIVPIWVSFPELPAHLFCKDALFSVASMIGSPLQVDTLTLNKSKLSQARVCVEIDLLKPIIEEFDLLVNGVTIVQKVVFEQLPEYCSLCKHVGHKDVNCFSKGNAPRPPPRSNLYTRQQQVAGTGMKQTRDKGKKVFEPVNYSERNKAPSTAEKAECSKANQCFDIVPIPASPLTVFGDYYCETNADQNGDDNVDENARKCNNCVDISPSTTVTAPGNDNSEMYFDKNKVANVDENEMACDNCFDLVPLSPNPFAILSEDLIDADTNEMVGDNVIVNDMDCTTMEEGSDDSCEQGESLKESPDSSFEEGATRGKHNRGLGSLDKQKHIHWLCLTHKPQVLVIIEPKVNLDDRYFCRRLGFDKVVCNTNSKIWCFTKNDLACDILISQEQLLHVRLSSNDTPKGVLCSWVYAKHTRAERRLLWDELRNIDPGDEPWLLGGDFNIILHASERKGGCWFEGAQFTWSRSRLWQRLDRFLFSHTWTHAFPLSRVQHLTRNVSDHCPLLLSVAAETKKGPAPFRFQNMWTKHHAFKQCVLTSWQFPINGKGMFKLQQKLYRLKAALKNWNWEVFGNIFQNIKEAEQKSKAAEVRYDNDPSDTNLIAMNKATAELTLALSMEECYWRQKSACKWLSEGEKNTKYFHSLVKKKRKNSHIHQIQHNDVILSSRETLQQSVVEYFTRAFTDEGDVIFDDLQCVPTLLTDKDMELLHAKPTMEDIKAVVFDMCPDSTAGPNGFSALFFQSCWDIIAEDLLEAVLDFFAGTAPPKTFTTTTVVLIPKSESPMTWKDFRPISLCNVTGKILSKLLNTQIATILPKIISPSQSGFVQGRMIADNILLAQELTHCLGKNCSTNNMIIKLDMAKAYDRLNWGFLYRILEKLGFHQNWISMVRKLIENCWFSILINGEGTGFFKSTRGLRQGDPLSPALFVIAAEYLSRGLDNLFTKHPKLRFFSKSALSVSHLAFADDVIIFPKGHVQNSRNSWNSFGITRQSRDSVSTKIKVLSQLTRGPLISEYNAYSKSQGFISNTFPSPTWAPLSLKGTRKVCSLMISFKKSKNRISGWEKALLSHGGRLQLIKSVLTAMPTYLLQTLKPPKYITERIERLFNKFFWGSFGEQKKMIWSSWESVCFPTEEGGFGVRKLDDVIEAFQHKLWWRFRNQQSLWSHFLLNKYCRGTHPVVAKPSYNASANWKRLCRSREKAEPHIFWSIGKGEVSFWFDNWTGERALCYLLGEQDHTTLPVNHFWKDKSWDTDKLKELLPSRLVHGISQVPFDDERTDLPHWKLSGDGTFTIKSTWNSFRQARTALQLFKEIWCPFVTPTMSIFLWRLLNDKIPVDQKIQSKGIQLASKCTCCNNIETLSHVFLDGPEISKVWEFFARKLNVILPSTKNITLFFSYWRFSSIGKNHIRTILPMLILWFCWLERNDSKHRGLKFNSDRIIWKVHQFIQTIGRTKAASSVNWRGDSNLAYCMGFPTCVKRKTNLMTVKWYKPDRGWIKINTDGASKGNPGPAGGIARDEKGMPIFAFYEFIGEATNMYAEVYGLFKALQICQTENIHRLWIEVDAVNLIRLIKEPSKGHWSLQNMLSYINLFLKKVEFRITHIYREGNKAADHFANLACSTKSSKVVRGNELQGHITGILKCDTPRHKRDHAILNGSAANRLEISGHIKGILKCDSLEIPYIRTK
ncbi:UNVERIFIED_CONTAM: putative ribonuclease H protein [Sesamum radiatum]|uniref:Ribonuclease H protein n=1 Tax=Sesamum radiatum TaxID=300843 RepID=A0AAW2TSQ1_SESRA